jgi:hypothetical protein
MYWEAGVAAAPMAVFGKIQCWKLLLPLQAHPASVLLVADFYWRLET